MGGLLVQDRDMGLEDRTEMQVVTERKPTEAEWGEMLFAWKVCKHVRSNAIVLSNDLASVGIGAGQMSRVDSVRLAIDKARAAGSSLLGAALASDAFFPFADGPQLAVDAGVTAIIQPGGSVRDHEVVAGRRRRRDQHGPDAPPPLQALARAHARPHFERMQARTIAKQIAYGRIAIGAALLVKPGLGHRPLARPGRGVARAARCWP